MIKLNINNIQFILSSNISVLEACKYAGITVSRFCFHELLSISGNCRMCLVEILNSPKPIASCVQPVINNMFVYTNTPLVEKAKENVIELLLLNHPLDCPICDQAGECDLQDQALNVGSTTNRFFFKKRFVEDKICGPLIKTIMTRCIHCTRCVRFYSEILNVDFLGTLNRSNLTEIGSYTLTSKLSELSGNVIDLCPVGALTSKSYAFKARPWELRVSNSIDLSDGLVSNTYLYFKNFEVLRVSPKVNSSLNENLITDKARFSLDGAFSNRLRNIYTIKDNILNNISWNIFLATFVYSLSHQKILFFIDDTLDLETINSLRRISYVFGSQLKIQSVSKKFYLKNYYVNWITNKISSIDKKSLFGFVFSVNMKIENALINMKIRKKVLNENFQTLFMGSSFVSDFSFEYVNFNNKSLLDLLESKSRVLSTKFIASCPQIYIGNTICNLGFTLLNLIHFFKSLLPNSIIIQIRSKCSTETLEFFNIRSVNKSSFLKAHCCVFIDLEDSYFLRKVLSSKKDKIWFNSHESELLIYNDFTVPTLSHLEAEKIYLNLEQRPQKSAKIFKAFPLLKNLSFVLNFLIKENVVAFSKKIISQSFIFELIENPFLFEKITHILNLSIFSKYSTLEQKRLSNYPVKNLIEDFYLTNIFCKNSKTMSKCSHWHRSDYRNF
jgi:NADH-quinone oxidoreductase subunit G